MLQILAFQIVELSLQSLLPLGQNVPLNHRPCSRTQAHFLPRNESDERGLGHALKAFPLLNFETGGYLMEHAAPVEIGRSKGGTDKAHPS